MSKIPQAVNNTYYIVQPSCHGNGGWCGSNVLKEFSSLEDALLFIPKEKHSDDFDSYFGDSSPRICTDKDPNHSLYILEGESGIWKWEHSGNVIDNGKTVVYLDNIREALQVIKEFNSIKDINDIELTLDGKIIEIPEKFKKEFSYTGLANKDIVRMFLMDKDTLPETMFETAQVKE